MRSILDKSFRYVPAVETDVKKTFARIRKQRREQAEQQAQADAEVTVKVRPIRKRGAAK